MQTLGKIGAIVLAAGRSTRFRSAGSKLLHALGGRPILQWPLAALRELGADPIVVVVGSNAEDVKLACGPDVTFVTQSEPRGTGHAVLSAAPVFDAYDGDVLIVNGDLPLLSAASLRAIAAEQRRTESVLTLATAILADPHGWGRIVRRGGVVRGIVEERDADETLRQQHEVNVGLYCLKPRVLFPMLERLRPDNSQGEIYLTDLVARSVEAGFRVADVRIDAHEVAQVNSRAELARMEKTLRAGINARWMENGVTLEDPDTTYIGPEVVIGRDTVIGPNVQLRGRTRLGEHCRLDGSAFLTDAVLGDHVQVRFAVVMTGVEVGDRCQIGPFANLRPGTRLAEEVHIGDFVETKAARVGARTKANHLAYLGDAEIGSDTNIGAGTITCNYDGFRKHRTVIGDRVQVGSDSQLVAPVTLADDVYVATGTTVRQDVPAGSLVYNPKPQLLRTGWVAERRARASSAAAASGGRSNTARTARASAGAKKPRKRVAQKTAAARREPKRGRGAPRGAAQRRR